MWLGCPSGVPQSPLTAAKRNPSSPVETTSALLVVLGHRVPKWPILLAGEDYLLLRRNSLKSSCSCEPKGAVNRVRMAIGIQGGSASSLTARSEGESKGREGRCLGCQRKHQTRVITVVRNVRFKMSVIEMFESIYIRKGNSVRQTKSLWQDQHNPLNTVLVEQTVGWYLLHAQCNDLARPNIKSVYCRLYCFYLNSG